jgi:alpha-glucosidase (family GH31 glycosyl hydrolase)
MQRTFSRSFALGLTAAFAIIGCDGGDTSSVGTASGDAGVDSSQEGSADAPDDVTVSDDATDVMPDVTPDVVADVVPDAGSECFADDAMAAPQQGFPGKFSLGDFEVNLDAEGRPEVTHALASGRSLFAVPSVGGWLTLAEADLQVEDHQGSFSIDEALQATCDATRVDEVRFDGKTLVIRGGYFNAAASCANATFEFQLCEVADGHLGFRASSGTADFNRISLRVASDAGERIYGMGEQVPHDTLNLKGRQIPVLAQEGGVGRGHGVITPVVDLASPGSGGSQESTYYAAPHYLTSRNQSLFLENTEVAVFDFRADDATEIRLYAERMDGRVLYGEEPLALIERFTDYTGRMPPLAEWANQGAIVALARDTESSSQIVNDLRAHGVEVAGVWNQTWSGKVTTYIGEQVLWNWVSNPTYHPAWNGYVEDLDAMGIRTLCYVNPMFVPIPEEAKPVSRNLYDEGIAGDYFVHDENGDVLQIPVTAFDVALLDLTNDAARLWMKEILKQEVMGSGGCSGWMVDFAEALPFNAVMASGQSGAEYHNQYPVEWMRLNREAVEEAGRLGDIMLFNRSGHTRTPAYSLLLWQGDQLTTWDKYDGLVSALRGLINGGFSGIALNHSDIGGYTSLSQWGLGYSREAEQLKRWAEMSAFTAAFRTHEGNQPGENAQIYDDDESMDHFARMSKVYKALAFYRTQLFQDAQTKGWPLVRHLMLHYPDDPKAQEVDDQFLLGSELLVAPIKNKCWTSPYCPFDKEMYFPRGEWVHVWSGEVFGSASGGVVDTVQAPIGEPAVFYKKGSAVGATFVANLQAAGISAADPPN